MLLKLIPALSEPTIHFSLAFGDLPDNLPTPPAWTAQLAQLMHEDLETPTTLHSLDRSAGVTSLLEEVELDIAIGEVRCRFIDGNVERWGFWEETASTTSVLNWEGGSDQYGKRLTTALEKIVRDVNESTLEDERVMREREWEKKRVERTRSVSSVTAASVAKAGKASRHKKSRSFFMSIVSAVGSIINLSSPSASNSPSSSAIFNPHSTFSYSSNPPSSSSTPTGPTGTSARARALRRAARSSLVDTYRLFVLTELVRRTPGPTISIETLENLSQKVERTQGYQRQEPVSFCIWILHSMRRRILERMEQILEEAEIELDEELSALDAASNAMGRRSICDDRYDGFEPTTMVVPMSFSDDEEEPIQDLEAGRIEAVPQTPVDAEMMDGESDWDTETDGSSVHTPSSTSHFPCYPGGSTSRTSSRSSNSSSTSSASDDLECRSATFCPPVPPKDLPQRQADPQSQFSTSLIPKMRPTIRLLISEPAKPVQPAQRLSSPALEEYTHLVESRKRLGQLILFAASQSRVANDDLQSRLEILAVRSRRRAWSNRALSMEAKSRTGLGGSAGYGLATPFRSSLLGRYMWTADDMADREESATSSAESSPTSSLSRYSGIAAFPSYRPKLRPKVRLDVEAVLGVHVNDTSFVDDEEEDAELTVMENKSGMYEQRRLPSPEKRVINRKVSMSAVRPPPVEKSRSVIGRLFPVSEEMEGEVQDHYPNDDQVFEIALNGKTTQRKEKAPHTFMGCDEVQVEGDADEEADLEEGETFVYTGQDCEEYPGEYDIEQGFGEFGDREVPFDVDSAMSGVEVVERPKVRPRVRTTGMMGAFLQRAKSMQNSFQSNHRRASEHHFELTKDSLLCQGVPVSVVSPSQPTPPASPPQLQTQSPVRYKRTNPPSPSQDNQKAIKIARTSSPAIYTNIEVNMLDVQVYDPDATDYGQYKDHVPYQVCSNQSSSEEFTLSMDIPSKRNHHRRREPHSQCEYPIRPLSRHEFEDNRRPKLNSIFNSPPLADMSSNPLISC